MATPKPSRISLFHSRPPISGLRADLHFADLPGPASSSYTCNLQKKDTNDFSNL